MVLSLINFDLFAMKRPRSHEKYVNKGNHFGGSKVPRAPTSVGEEYIVTIVEIVKEGSGVARLRGVSIFVNNTNPGDKVMVRITRSGTLSYRWLLKSLLNRKKNWLKLCLSIQKRLILL